MREYVEDYVEDFLDDFVKFYNKGDYLTSLSLKGVVIKQLLSSLGYFLDDGKYRIKENTENVMPFRRVHIKYYLCDFVDTYNNNRFLDVEIQSLLVMSELLKAFGYSLFDGKYLKVGF